MQCFSATLQSSEGENFCWSRWKFSHVTQKQKRKKAAAAKGLRFCDWQIGEIASLACFLSDLSILDLRQQRKNVKYFLSISHIQKSYIFSFLSRVSSREKLWATFTLLWIGITLFFRSFLSSIHCACELLMAKQQCVVVRAPQKDFHFTVTEVIIIIAFPIQREFSDVWVHAPVCQLNRLTCKEGSRRRRECWSQCSRKERIVLCHHPLMPKFDSKKFQSQFSTVSLRSNVLHEAFPQ